MTSKEHKKHAFLQKPLGGKFNRNEFALIGAPCPVIQQLATSITKTLEKEYKIGYVDADHGVGEEKPVFSRRYTDKISHHRLEFQQKDLSYAFRGHFNAEDAVLINGNHFQASRQIVIINEQKKESLGKKLDRLTHVIMILLDDGMEDVHDFLKEHIPDHASLPTFSIREVDRAAETLRSLLATEAPRVKGLVLAGGDSTRMGQDKGAIHYHGKAQREFMADLLSQFCEETYISKKPSKSIESQYPFIEDSFLDLGPYGGILSAFRHDPNAAWLCVACDIPMLDHLALEKLVKGRDASQLATCFHNPDMGFPEPLITLWEPRAYPALLYFLSLGYSCPRKVLINSDVKTLELKDTQVLTNVNTPEEYEKVKSKINA